MISRIEGFHCIGFSSIQFHFFFFFNSKFCCNHLIESNKSKSSESTVDVFDFKVMFEVERVESYV